jgi:hypothetical protein
MVQSISGVSAINPLVAFYDIHGGKRDILLAKYSFLIFPNFTSDFFLIYLHDAYVFQVAFSMHIQKHKQYCINILITYRI